MRDDISSYLTQTIFFLQRAYETSMCACISIVNVPYLRLLEAGRCHLTGCTAMYTKIFFFLRFYATLFAAAAVASDFVCVLLSFKLELLCAQITFQLLMQIGLNIAA